MKNIARYATFFCAVLFLATSCGKNDDKTPVDPTVDDAGDDNENSDHAAPTTFTVADLLQTARKGTTRFERLAIADSSFHSIKTWKSETYSWMKLTYRLTTSDGSTTEEHLFLACHFHGDQLGCHKKDESDPSEPTDTQPDNELPTIDDKLPPIE